MKLRLKNVKLEAKGTKSFFWEAENKITYLPGQYFYFTIPNLKYPDPRGNTRHFTISSSPTEENLIRNTTRIRESSGYKKTLNELPIGSKIQGEGPNGTFILDENEKGVHVLIAGGIGITPFRSFIKYNIDKQSLADSVGKELKDIKLHLIYANSVPEEIAFQKELEEWAKNNENIKVEMTVSHPEQSQKKWGGLAGRIDESMIKKLVKKWSLNIKNLNFWITGPPPMVEAVEKALGSLQITSDKVRSEKFTGY